jgi:putative chitinase
MLEKSVGRSGQNRRADVRTAQRLINLARNQWPDPLAELVPDGLYGSRTQAAIDWAQRSAAPEGPQNGVLSPGDATDAALSGMVPAEISEETVSLIFANAALDRVSLYWQHLAPAMQRYGIDTPLRQAHFLAQIGHESGELRYNEELASGEAYEDRKDLGNTEIGDGVRFKGRGLIQLTGRANYTDYGKAIGRDLLTDAGAEQVAEDPVLAVDVACWFWKTRGLNALADQDDIEAVTRRINGGLNGLDDRKRLRERARAVLRA